MQSSQKFAMLAAALAFLGGAGWMAAGSISIGAQDAAAGARAVAAAGGSERLAVVWTSGDPEVAHRVALMYTHAAKRQGWFDEVRLIIWGPSQRLLAADKDVKAYIKRLQDDGVIVQACIVCADSYGLTEDLRALGIEVKAMGMPLTEHLKEDWRVLSF
jgi:hypothetical protein